MIYYIIIHIIGLCRHHAALGPASGCQKDPGATDSVSVALGQDPPAKVGHNVCLPCFRGVRGGARKEGLGTTCGGAPGCSGMWRLRKRGLNIIVVSLEPLTPISFRCEVPTPLLRVNELLLLSSPTSSNTVSLHSRRSLCSLARDPRLQLSCQSVAHRAASVKMFDCRLPDMASLSRC